MDLFQYRWAVPVLGAFHTAGGGTRFAALMRGLGVGRPSLVRTLDFLLARGWIRRNPGYGHPLRPEYVLTAAGRPVAEWAAELHAKLVRLGVEDAGLRKWPLAVALVLWRGTERFNEVQAALPGVTARALKLALDELERAGLVRRRVLDERPPRVAYRLERTARGLAPLLAALPG